MIKDKKLLVVYNICGIKYDNIKMWMDHLENIINQEYPNFILAISGCMVSNSSKDILKKFKSKYNNIILNFIEDKLPVNVTFNHTVQVCVKQFGEFDGYLYVASDVNFNNDKNVLSKLMYVHSNSNSALTYALVDHDHGLEATVPPELLQDLHKLLETDHFTVNIGKGANMHVVLFDKDIYTNYNHKIIPDIFATHCTETTYSYLAASLGKKFIIHNKDIMLTHIGFADGHSVGFIDEIQYRDDISWKHLFRSSIPADDRLLNNEAKACGFGYGEWKEMILPGEKILYRDETLYDEDENHKEPQKLLSFLKKAIYLSKEEFDYDSINYKLI